MAQPPDGSKRQCPTRIDGGDSLICHLIDLTACQSRQRDHYHKCHVCTHRNDGSARRVQTPLPVREAAVPGPGGAQLRVDRAG